jgi:hypothetical protein
MEFRLVGHGVAYIGNAHEASVWDLRQWSTNLYSWGRGWRKSPGEWKPNPGT